MTEEQDKARQALIRATHMPARNRTERRKRNHTIRNLVAKLRALGCEVEIKTKGQTNDKV